MLEKKLNKQWVQLDVEEAAGQTGPKSADGQN